MENMQTILDTLKAQKEDFLTTQQLYQAGLTKYYVKKLVDDGTLKRMKIGYYTFPKNWIKAVRSFHLFARKVTELQYEEAYLALRQNILLKENNEHDTHIRIFLMMLQELLPNQVDSSLLQELDCVPSFQQPNGELSMLFQAFEKDVLNRDFEEAYQDFRVYKELLSQVGEKNFTSTFLFQQMLTSIHIQKKESGLLSEWNYLDNRYHMVYYQQLLASLQRNDYPKAIESIRNLKRFVPDIVALELARMMLVLENYQTSGESLPDTDEIDYSMLEQDDMAIFHRSLLEKDYVTASSQVDKLLLEFPDELELLVAKRVLEKVCPKEFMIEEIESGDVRLTLTLEKLYELVHNRQYDEARKELKEYRMEHPKEPRTFVNASKLLYVMNRLKECSMAYDVPNITYEKRKRDVFGYFFEALNKRDYFSAYEGITQILKRPTNSTTIDYECLIYQDLLEDVCAFAKENIDKRDTIKEMQRLNVELRELLYQKRNYYSVELEQLHAILMKKETLFKELNWENPNAKFETMLISLLNMYNTLKSHHGKMEDYFETFDRRGGNLKERFEYAVAHGDLATVYRIMHNPEWFSSVKDSLERSYLDAYERILWQMKQNLESPIRQKVSEMKEKEPNVAITILENIRCYLKKNDYIGAERYYWEHMDEVSSDIDTILKAVLPLFKKYEQHYEQSILEQYEKYMAKGEFEKAKIAIEEYQKEIAGKHTDCNLDYYYRSIELAEKRVHMPQFVKAEQLYDLARYQYSQLDTVECLKTLEEYLQLDQDMSDKGYLLRGEVYESMGDVNRAQDDYWYALKISNNPEAYLNLGTLLFQDKKYKEALQNFEEVEKRAPEKYWTNLDMLANTYEALKDSEKASHYRKIGQKVLEDRIDL